ncbi:hypothetical protein F52700_2595 [Fusarium sp. NRRL 52700]|nr:hypothetical protein F52700_2595 [Fusarium sp. NRRL 52700]
MSHDLTDDLTEEGLRMIEELEEKSRREMVFQDDWRPGLPVPMPELTYDFSKTALQVGHFIEDIPGFPESPNRKKNAKAYLAVKHVNDDTFFLWCDADGNPVDKKNIQLAEGLDMQQLKLDLMEMYNRHEFDVVMKYNIAMKVAKDRLALNYCELNG